MQKRGVFLLITGVVVAQLGVWAAANDALVPRTAAEVIRFILTWALIGVLAMLALRRINGWHADLRVQQVRHESTLGQIQQLEVLNELLLTVGRAKDVGLAFQALARRVGALVPCDRLALGLLQESGHRVLTFTARVTEPERRRRPRPELEFGLDRSLFGQVIRTCEALRVSELAVHASDFGDASALASSGMTSALVLPLVARNRAIGALMVLSRQPAAFTTEHLETMQPMAEILAFAFVAQQQHEALEKFTTMESVSEMSIALASDINGSLQGIIGEAGVLQRLHPEMATAFDGILHHAGRIAQLMETMRRAAKERHGEPDLAASIPASPEAFGM